MWIFSHWWLGIFTLCSHKGHIVWSDNGWIGSWGRGVLTAWIHPKITSKQLRALNDTLSCVVLCSFITPWKREYLLTQKVIQDRGIMPLGKVTGDCKFKLKDGLSQNTVLLKNECKYSGNGYHQKASGRGKGEHNMVYCALNPQNSTYHSSPQKTIIKQHTKEMRTWILKSHISGKVSKGSQAMAIYQ